MLGCDLGSFFRAFAATLRFAAFSRQDHRCSCMGHFRQLFLAHWIALRRRDARPHVRFHVIARHAASSEVEQSQHALRAHLPLLGGDAHDCGEVTVQKMQGGTYLLTDMSIGNLTA